ncbi:glutamate receptor ionotropic, kainate glr-3-like [Daphnia pulex]|uniref:glutamate receptor ionotropic, kainate glr-3-like n=1 Tax=Daphnia pulex TaxID=6669 RepID=UPI001EE07146|nr:glutamate receptor ionotropic, kainate glr-3-like [Daphnia pulex]
MKIQILFLLLNGLLVNSHQHLLKFGMLERPPHFMAKNSTGIENEPYQGSWVEAVKWLSRRQKYKIIPMNNNIAGNLQIVNGSASWSGASGRLLRGDFDLLGPQILLSSGRNRFFDFVGVADEEPSALLTPGLTEESPITSTVKPFQSIVWLMVLISLLSVTIYFSASSTLNLGGSNKNAKSFRIGDYFLYTTAVLINQGSVFWQPNHQSRISFRLAAGVWCLFALVMVNVYSGTLTAHITARKMSIPPRHSMIVMEQGVLSYLAFDDGFAREFILSATTGKLKKMGDMFRRHPENFVPDQETAFQKVASGCCAYNDVVNYLKFRLTKDFQETGKCRVHIGQPIKDYGLCGLILRKGDIHKTSMNKGILELYQTGLVGHWRKRYSFGESPCESQKKNKSKKLRRLNLQDLASAFFILGIGVLISFLVFLAEQFRRLKSQKKQLRN